MTQTTNYQLNQWEATDQVRRTDFNADNAKIDAALKAEADARAAAVSAEANTRAAAVNAINAALAGKARVAAGHYTGDGAASRTISVGFTPKAVFVCTTEGYIYMVGNGFGPSAPYGGLAVTGSPIGYPAGPTVEIVSGGFKVAYRTENGVARSNVSGTSYNYIALA